MSYILQALKRAEADRRGDQPATGVRPVRRPMSDARRPLWPWIVGAALALNAAVIGAVLFVRGPSGVTAPGVIAPGTAPGVTTPAVTPAVEHSPAVALPPSSQPPPTSETRPPSAGRAEPRDGIAARPAQPTPSVPATTPAAAAPRATSSPAVAARPRDENAPANRTAAPRRRPAEKKSPVATKPPAESTARVETPAAPAPAPLAPRSRVVDAPKPSPPVVAAPAPSGELAALASKVKIEALVWATDPKDRMIFVNGRKYVEGQTLEGALIQQIVEDGVILVQQGQRVRVRAETR